MVIIFNQILLFQYIWFFEQDLFFYYPIKNFLSLYWDYSFLFIYYILLLVSQTYVQVTK